MREKILIMINTAEKEKVRTAIMFVVNSLPNGWTNDLKLIFLRPSEKLITESSELQELLQQLLDGKIQPIACKFLSDEANFSERLVELGFSVEYVGEKITNLIKEGYVPMVW